VALLIRGARVMTRAAKSSRAVDRRPDPGVLMIDAQFELGPNTIKLESNDQPHLLGLPVSSEKQVAGDREIRRRNAFAKSGSRLADARVGTAWHR
jgi:hypothetical protein